MVIPGIVGRPFGSDVVLFQVRLALGVAPNAVEPRHVGCRLLRPAQDRGGPQKHQGPNVSDSFLYLIIVAL